MLFDMVGAHTTALGGYAPTHGGLSCPLTELVNVDKMASLVTGTKLARWVAIATFLCSCACLLACAEQGDDRSNQAAVQKVRSEALDALNAGDTDRLLSLLAEDAILMHQDGPTAVGREEISRDLKSFFQHARLQVSRSARETTISGDWAFDHGILSGTLTVDSKTLTFSNPAHNIFKRQPDDSWKYTRFMGLPYLGSAPSTAGDAQTPPVEAGQK